jgi:hypothetical protein
MNTFPKIPPSSVRSGSGTNFSPRMPEARPYLVTGMNLHTRPSQKSTLPLFPHESEDARLTGDTRSLFRRLLALNLPVTMSESITTRKTTTITHVGRTA